MKTDERRVKIVLVSERLLLSLFQGPGECVAIRLDHPKLPADAKVVRVSHDFDRMGFRLMVQSESFDHVPAGAMVPYFDEGHYLAECHLRYIDGDRVSEESPLSLMRQEAEQQAEFERMHGPSPLATVPLKDHTGKVIGSADVNQDGQATLHVNESSREWFQREMSRTD